MKKYFVVFFLLSLTTQTWAAPIPPVMVYETKGLDVNISWSAVSGASGYKLYYAPFPYAGPTTILSVDVANQTNKTYSLWQGAAYHIAVTAYDGSGESGYSNIGQFTIKPNCAGSDSTASSTPVLPLPITNMDKKFTSCATLDANADGFPDLVLGGHPGVHFTEDFPSDLLLLNDGTGHFPESSARWLPPRYGGGTWGTLGMKVADLNNDGKDDLLLTLVDAEYTAGFMQLFYSNGDGSFTDGTNNILDQASVEGNITYWAYPHDFDGDGAMDFMNSAGDTFPTKVFKQQGDGTFIPLALPGIDGSPNGANAYARDINKDGLPDIIMSHVATTVFVNTSTPGEITFAVGEEYVDNTEDAVLPIIIDVDGDADQDIILTQVFIMPDIGGYGSLDSPLFWHENDGTGQFSTAKELLLNGSSVITNNARDHVIADFNGDGHDDLLIVDHGYDAPPHPGQQNTLLLSGPGGGLSNASDKLPQRNDFSHGVCTADFNGDGFPDFYVANISGGDDLGPAIYLNDGIGGFCK